MTQSPHVERTTVQIVSVKNGVEKHMTKKTIYEPASKVWKLFDEFLIHSGLNTQRPQPAKAGTTTT